MEKFYTTSKSIGKENLESIPEFELGFDYDGQHIEIGDDPYYKSEAGPVSISDLIEKLQVFQILKRTQFLSSLHLPRNSQKGFEFRLWKYSEICSRT